MASPSGHSTKATLSKTVLEMKFMQRKKEAEIRKKLEEERQRDINEAQWTSQNSVDGSAVEMGLSFGDCQPMEPCARRSFHKFNPTVEKLFRQLKYDSTEQEAMKREEEDTVTEEDMADRYENLVSTIAKKFTKPQQQDSRMDDVRAKQSGGRKRKPDGEKRDQDQVERPRKFLKPSD